MEILFFRLGARVAGIPARNVRIVLHKKETVPFLPLSAHIRDMIVNQGKAVGVIDLHSLFSVPRKEADRGDIILLQSVGIEFGLSVSKILITRRIHNSFFQPVERPFFIPDVFLSHQCAVGSKYFPVLSETRILNYPDIRVFWDKKKSVGNVL